MADDLKIRAVIEFILRDKGIAEAQQELRKLESEVERAKTALAKQALAAAAAGEDTDKYTQALAATDAQLAAVRAKQAELAASTEGASDATRTQTAAQTDQADATRAQVSELDQLGEATARYVSGAEASAEQARQFAQAIQDQGGPLLSETIPALERYQAITGTAAEAMASLQLALDLAREGELSFADASRAVASVLEGDMVRAAETLGIAVRTSSGDLRSHADILADLRARYGDLTTRAEDARIKVTQFATGAAAAGTASKGLAAGIASIGLALRAAIPGLGVIAALTAGIRFLKNAIVRNAEEQRALNALRIQLEALGVEGGPSLAAIHQGLIRIERDGGPAIESTLPVFQKLLGLTRDTAAAMELTGLAARIEDSGMLDATAAGEALANVLQGRASAAAKQLGVQIEEGASRLEVFMAIARQFPEALDGIDDTKEAFDRVGGAVKGAGRDLSEAFGPAVEFVSGLLAEFVNGLRSAGAIAVDVASAIISSFATVGQTLFRALDLGTLFDDPAAYWENVKAAYNNGAQNLSDLLEQSLAKQDEIWGRSGKRAAEERQKALDTIAALLAAAEAKEAEEAARKTEIARLKAQMSALQEGSAERLRIEKQILDLEEAQALAAAEETGETKAGIEARFRDEHIAAEQRHAQALAAIARESALAQAQARAQAIPESNAADRLAADLEVLRVQRENALAEAKLRGADVAEIERTFADLALARQREFDELRRQQAFEAEASILQSRLAAFEEGSRQRLDLELQLLDLESAERIRRAGDDEKQITAIRLAAAMARFDLVADAEAASLAKQRAQAQELGDAELDAALAINEQRLASTRITFKEMLGLELERIAIEREAQEGAVEAWQEEQLERVDRQAATAEAGIEAARRENEHAIRSQLERTLASIELYREENEARLRALGASQEEIEQANAKFNDRRIRATEDAEAQIADVNRQASEDRKATQEEAEKDRLAIIQAALTRIAAIRIRSETAEKQQIKSNKLAKIAAYEEVAAVIGSTLRSIFGENKAAAIAEAVISTALAVAKTLAMGGPFAIPLALAIAAMGLAQVSKIRSTNIGDSGGGGEASAAPQMPREIKQASFIGSQPDQAQAPASTPKLPGFAEGGVVPGQRGEPVVAVVHGGETVLPVAESEDWLAWRRHVEDEQIRAAEALDATSEEVRAADAASRGRDGELDQRITRESIASDRNIANAERRSEDRDQTVDRGSIARDDRLSWRISNLVQQINDQDEEFLGFSFDRGGVVPGPQGAAQRATVHGGEVVLPADHPLARFFRETVPVGAPMPAGIPGAGAVGVSSPVVASADVPLGASYRPVAPRPIETRIVHHHNEQIDQSTQTIHEGTVTFSGLNFVGSRRSDAIRGVRELRRLERRVGRPKGFGG